VSSESCFGRSIYDSRPEQRSDRCLRLCDRGAALLQCVRSIVATGLPCVIVADPRAITPDISDIISNNSLEFIDGAIPVDVFVTILSRKH
jgi:hypothetical protein